jgi:MSHA pilin protein MshD
MNSRPTTFRLLASRGFTLVEVCVSVVIVAVMLAASMQTVGQSRLMQYRLTERTRGSELAGLLMDEIMQQYYCDPVGGTGTLGPDSGETRAIYNDVDDYASFSESPPTNKDGTSVNLQAPTTWRRTATVIWVNPTTLAAAASESGAKKITVNVYHNGFLVSTLSAIRGNGP